MPRNRPTTYLRTGANARTAYALVSTTSTFASGASGAASGSSGRPPAASQTASSNPAYASFSMAATSFLASRIAAHTASGVAGGGTETVACATSPPNLKCTATGAGTTAPVIVGSVARTK